MLRSGKGPMVVAALTLGIVGASSAPLEAAECPNSEAALEVQLAGSAQDALSGLLQCIAGLREEISELKSANTTEPIPAGAVVAFAFSSKKSDPAQAWYCPPGWKSFEPAGGRMIVGAGFHNNLDENGQPLTDYPSWYEDQAKAIGGAEAHEIRKEEMPSHLHVLALGTFQFSGKVGSNKTHAGIDEATEGGAQTSGNGSVDGTGDVKLAPGEKLGQPHNNMPPYVALHFCRKEAG